MSTSWKWPKIHIQKTKSEWTWDIIGYASYLGSVLFLMIVWNMLPDEVPAHYNAMGEVDRWGSKWEMVILPIVGAFLLVTMQIVEKYPEVHNYPARLNESNAEKFYLSSRKLVNQLKNICLILFAFIIFESASIALDWGSGFSIWFLPLTLLGTGVPIIVGIMKQRKIK
ncbi:DUF1648 domain-containing protein [Metabacillus schmidteae]|uniref:DUF1648 domain-containing protein n=1 Tax=Metabacillus schmidteae TaxID=2730405 RepID=UPI00158DDF04|nr:DUF1648 domain-containing protein [Metabacillus schmidteae]